ncbi:suppressor of fused domain protein (plasmid) [Chryseobacterium panacisoli]|uniref:Suppressor of fused domain protein n=1 Tax=Chryseobacterium panacisoli TaxID=1807141 RepID=A0A5D8ZYP4_9FLAO|nr:suppressor of fused domain protein [Chryseobacterium panacisoli]TZG00039.1 suppressor of fused domain protein [Chryseobacterium panacisoli]
MFDKISIENKNLAKYITTIVGINEKIDRHWDELNINFIDIFECDDQIYPNIKIFGTIGVSDHPNRIEMNDGNLKNIPIELLICGYKEFDMLSDILTIAGFFITKKGWECQPGSVFMRIVDMYYEDSEMRHIIFVSPFLWQGKLKPLDLSTKTVHWLLCIPISDNELEYRMKNGASALEDIFQEKDIDIFDINRKSVI